MHHLNTGLTGSITGSWSFLKRRRQSIKKRCRIITSGLSIHRAIGIAVIKVACRPGTRTSLVMLDSSQNMHCSIIILHMLDVVSPDHAAPDGGELDSTSGREH